MKITCYTDAIVLDKKSYSASIVLTKTQYLTTLFREHKTTRTCEAEMLGVLACIKYVRDNDIPFNSLVVYTDSTSAAHEFTCCMQSSRVTIRTTHPYIWAEILDFCQGKDVQVIYKAGHVWGLNGITSCHNLCKRLRGGA